MSLKKSYVTNRNNRSLSGNRGERLRVSSLSNIPYCIVDVIEPFSEHTTYDVTSTPLTTKFGGPGNFSPD